MKQFLFALVLSIPTATFADCNPEGDGDCCRKDSDCAAFFHPPICAIIPLNKTSIARFEKENLPLSDFCKGLEGDLRKELPHKKAFCAEGTCELEGDADE
jgi:hypothetical protein